MPNHWDADPDAPLLAPEAPDYSGWYEARTVQRQEVARRTYELAVALARGDRRMTEEEAMGVAMTAFGLARRLVEGD